MVQIVDERLVEGGFDRLGAQVGHIGQPDAQRGEHPGVGVDEDRGDAEPIGHPARMLPARSAEAHERVGGDVVTAFGADLADRVGHVLGCDLAVAKRHLGGAAPHTAGLRNLLGQFGDTGGGCVDIERFGAAGAEHRREVLGPDHAEHRVGIGDGQRAAVAVAGRSGVGSSRVRTYPQAAAVEGQHRTAAGCHRVHIDDRGTHADARDFGLVRPLELTGEVRDIGRCAAHVESDQPLEAGRLGGTSHTHDTAGWA